MREFKKDFIVVGGGIVGLTIARALKLKYPNAEIVVLEKESVLGLHGSGRNSGVVHSGIYYPPNSLKAKICVSGAKAMKAYCEEYALPLLRMGKVIISTKEENDSQIDMLYQRAITNGVNVSIVDRQALAAIEPEASTRAETALHSPDTAVVDPSAVIQAVQAELWRLGVEILFDVKIKSVFPDHSEIHTNIGKFVYGKLFNATGQHSDHIAHLFQVGRRYTMLPFKGQYYALADNSHFSFNGLIYPVPDMNMPFLGVHTVKTAHNKIYFGPSAVPAFGRENYVGFKGVEPNESVKIIRLLLAQYYYNNQGFRNYAHSEAVRIFKSKFVEAIQALVPRLRGADIIGSSKVGLRAQLLDLDKKELVGDFVVEAKDNTVHVLNAVSPAFTCSFGFAQWIVDNY